MSGMLPAALVYVLDTDQGTKVGVTRGTIDQRVVELARGCGLPPAAIRVVRTYPMPSAERARVVERSAHWLLRDTRTVGEWFHCHPLEAADAVAQARRYRYPLDTTNGPIDLRFAA